MKGRIQDPDPHRCEKQDLKGKGEVEDRDADPDSQNLWKLDPDPDPQWVKIQDL
jgi:hypothetical protein